MTAPLINHKSGQSPLLLLRDFYCSLTTYLNPNHSRLGPSHLQTLEKAGTTSHSPYPPTSPPFIPFWPPVNIDFWQMSYIAVITGKLQMALNADRLPSA